MKALVRIFATGLMSYFFVACGSMPGQPGTDRSVGSGVRPPQQNRQALADAEERKRQKEQDDIDRDDELEKLLEEEEAPPQPDPTLRDDAAIDTSGVELTAEDLEAIKSARTSKATETFGTISKNNSSDGSENGTKVLRSVSQTTKLKRPTASSKTH